MSTPTVKELLRDSLLQSKKMYLEDLEAMAHEDLGRSPGGKARTPYDFTYETSVLNRRVAMRLRGEDPGPPPWEGWAKAPSDFQSKETALQAIEGSADEVLAGLEAMPEARLGETITLPQGVTSPLEMVRLVANHMHYHDAQLNYHQAICGDEAMHWTFD